MKSISEQIDGPEEDVNLGQISLGGVLPRTFSYSVGVDKLIVNCHSKPVMARQILSEHPMSKTPIIPSQIVSLMCTFICRDL